MAEELLAGWDDDEPGQPQAAAVEEPPEEEADSGEGLAADAPEESEEEPDQDEGAPVEEGEEGPPPTGDEGEEAPEDDPEVQALLARYNNDPQAALRAHVELRRAYDRQGTETGQLRGRIAQMEADARRAARFSTAGGQFLSPEQHEWVEQAAGSGQQVAYIQQAVEAGEFGLARAVTDQWAMEDPYSASRIATLVDQAEQELLAAQQPQGFDQGTFVSVLADAYPDMPSYEPQMVEVVQRLGIQHPLVAAARSGDPEAAMRGWVGIYEIAKAGNASVKNAKDQIKQKNKQAAATAREEAVVTSRSASPQRSETPPEKRIFPGLTLGELQAEWDK